MPGVGKRTAQRLLIDLKAKLALPDIDLAALNAQGGAATEALTARVEVRDALHALGYSNDEIRGALAEMRAEASVADAIREALRMLGARR